LRNQLRQVLLRFVNVNSSRRHSFLPCYVHIVAGDADGVKSGVLVYKCGQVF
jgi:hypothetical protein